MTSGLIKELEEARALLRNAADAIDVLSERYHESSEAHQEAEELIGEIGAFLGRAHKGKDMRHGE